MKNEDSKKDALEMNSTLFTPTLVIGPLVDPSEGQYALLLPNFTDYQSAEDYLVMMTFRFPGYTDGQIEVLSS